MIFPKDEENVKTKDQGSEYLSDQKRRIRFFPEKHHGKENKVQGITEDLAGNNGNDHRQKSRINFRKQIIKQENIGCYLARHDQHFEKFRVP